MTPHRTVLAFSCAVNLLGCTVQICYGHDECLSSEVCNFETRKCIPSVCGDGVVRAPEECDDGNTENQDGCSASCRVEPLVWQRVDFTSPPLDAAALAFDRARGVLVLFGGLEGETWEWNGDGWARVETAASPPPRSQAAAVYDVSRGVVVMVGGSGANGMLRDTWEYDGTTWTEQLIATPPSIMVAGRFAYDELRSLSVALAWDDMAQANRTWIYDGVDWRESNSGPEPTGSSVATAYDASAMEVIAVTAESHYTSFLVWSFDGIRWNPIDSPLAPRITGYPPLATSDPAHRTRSEIT